MEARVEASDDSAASQKCVSFLTASLLVSNARGRSLLLLPLLPLLMLGAGGAARASTGAGHETSSHNKHWPATIS